MLIRVRMTQSYGFVQDMHRRVFLEDVAIDSAEVDADVEF